MGHVLACFGWVAYATGALAWAMGRLRGGRAGLGHVLACFRLFAYAAGGIGLPAPCTPGRASPLDPKLM